MQTDPFVTIIMPIRNEAAHIARSLGAVLAQDYPHDKMEVLVVDGMSDDGTRDIVRRLIAQHQATPSRGIAPGQLPTTCQPSAVPSGARGIVPTFRPSPFPNGASESAPTLQRSNDLTFQRSSVPTFLLDNPGRIVPTAFNIGLRHARGDIIVRVDGHSEIAPDYVRRCVELLQETDADNVGGVQRAGGSTWIGRITALATSSPFGVGGARFRYSNTGCWVKTVYLGAYRREVFERIGGFDEEMVRNQDDEFNFRLTQAGGKIWLDPSIRVTYYSRATLRGLWRQYFQYGLYKVRVTQKRGAIPFFHLVPALFVLGLAATLLAALITGQPLWALAVAGPYAIANLAASLLAARKDWSTLPLLPVAFLIVHLAYGLGFLRGLWHWRQHGAPLRKLKVPTYGAGD